MNEHDRKLRCQWELPAKFDSTWYDSTQKYYEKRKKILSYFSLSLKCIKITSPRSFARAMTYSTAFTFMVYVCLLFVEYVIWIFIRAHASQMAPNLIKKLFTSNHLNRKSSETFVTELFFMLCFPVYKNHVMLVVQKRKKRWWRIENS